MIHSSSLTRLYWILHRYNSFRAEVGLKRIGSPTPNSPVLVSGNYALTVERLESVLTGQDCWLLIADSAGINVWCAAGVGDFNEQKVIDAIEATNLRETVFHRNLIFPPLAAVGINRVNLKRLSGFDLVWGPNHLEDLPEFFKSGMRRSSQMRLAKFPLRDRFELAIGMLGVFFLSLILFFKAPRRGGWFLFSIAHAIFGSLVGYYLLPPKYPANKTLLLGFFQFVGLLLVRPSNGRISLKERILWGFIAHVLIAIDMIGSTPFYKTTIFHWVKTGTNDALFQPGLNKNCTSCGNCEEVCPKGLFIRNSHGKIEIDLSMGCCECMACLKQCPHQAIDNIGAGWKDDIKSLDEIPKSFGSSK